MIPSTCNMLRNEDKSVTIPVILLYSFPAKCSDLIFCGASLSAEEPIASIGAAA